MNEFLIANMAPIMFASLILFLMFGYAVAFSLAACGLFFGFVGRALLIARRNELSNRLFAAYLGYGIAFLFLGQVLINMAVNVGLLPTKGLTLPFLSYGGSSLIMCLVMFAVLLRIDIEHHHQNQPRTGAKAL